MALALAALAMGCAPAGPPAATTVGHPPTRWFGDTTPPAEDVFTFTNGAEPETIDPSLMTGQPDGRVARIMFEGLTIPHPETLAPLPGQAYRWNLSEDGRTYTFHLRPGIAWSDGRPIVAADFVWSWRRVLAPESAARYASLLYPIAGAEDFNRGAVGAEALGLAAPDDSTFVVRLRTPVAYFLYLTQFYPYLPTPRHVVEAHGDRWTRPEHVVSNGAFLLDVWKPQDRFEFVPNPRYWGADAIRLDRIVAISTDDLNTSTNLYKAGVIDWLPSGQIPSPFIPHMRQFGDYRHGRYQGTYFYSINVTRAPYDDVWVRRALAHAIDRDAIANDLLKGSRDPWGYLCPSGYLGYTPPPNEQRYDPEKAREYLAKAGYPGGKGFPKIEILFNTSEDHRRIAEAIQAMWKRDLAIDVELSNQEWGSYLQATTHLQYGIARRSWIGDYLDPNTFLSIFVTGDGNNRTGWSNARYDALLRGAEVETDPARRMAMLAEAERIILDEAPVLAIYHYSTNECVKPYVRGLHRTALDTHPLQHVWIDRTADRRAAPVAERRHDAPDGR